MNKKEKISVFNGFTCEFVRNAALVFLAIVMGYIVYVCINEPYELNIKRYAYLDIGIITSGSIICILCILILGTAIYHSSDKMRKYFLIFLSGIMIVTQILIIIKIQNVPTNDLSHIIGEAKRMLNGFRLYSIDYYGKYPNNFPLLFVVYLIYKTGNFFGIDNVNLLASFFNVFCIDLSILLIYLTAKRICGKKVAALVIMVCILNPLLYVYAPYYYTDTLSMPFFAGIIYLVAIIIQDKDISRKKRIVRYVLLAIITGVGFQIRATVIIPVIALVVYSWFVKCFRKNILLILSTVVGMIVVMAVYNGCLNHFTDMDYINSELKFPTVHWIMMGMGTDGSYSDGDMEYTMDAGDYEQKKEADKELLKERVLKFGSEGLHEHILEKTKVTWAGGTGGFYKKIKVVREYGEFYDVLIGEKNHWFVYYCMMYNSALRFFTLVGLIIYIVRRKPGYMDFLYTILTGAIMFYWLWEASSRYSYCFSPITLILMAYGIEECIKVTTKMGKNQIMSEYRHIPKVFAGILVILVIIPQIKGAVYINNNTEYARSFSARQETSLNSDNKDLVNSDNTVSQTFTAFTPFDSLEIKVNKISDFINAEYKLELKDESGNLICQKKFNTNDLSGHYVCMSFDTITPQKGQMFMYTLSTDSLEGNLLIQGTHSDEYTVYEDGCFYSNSDRVESFSAAFNVFKIDEYHVFNIYIYILLCFCFDACLMYVLIKYIKYMKNIDTITE